MKHEYHDHAPFDERDRAAGVLTLAEAAELLRVPEDGLKADAVADRVPGRLVAGEWRFHGAALLRWLGQPANADSRPATNRGLADHMRLTAMSSADEAIVVRTHSGPDAS